MADAGTGLLGRQKRKLYYYGYSIIMDHIVRTFSKFRRSRMHNYSILVEKPHEKRHLGYLDQVGG
jgi:hypothetical protein